MSCVTVVALLVSFPVGTAGQTTSRTPPAAVEPIRYTLSFPAPHTHYVEVRAIVPTSGRASIEMMMAVWTPGSYLVREFERHVESVTAASSEGRSLPLEKSRKNRWRIMTGGSPTI